MSSSFTTSPQDSERRNRFIDVAAIVALYEVCGHLPERLATDLPAACEPEALPVRPPRTRQFFEQMLEGQHADVLPEALRLAAEKDFRLFADLLPALLELGTKRAGLRDAIAPVLGEGGPWLARQNPAWEWAAAANTTEENALEEIWQTRSRDKRLILLRELHRTEPAWALALLASTWEQEAPEDRVSSEMEGLYIKVEEEGHVVERYKYVRASFLASVENSGSHWLERPVVPNALRSGVDIFAKS